MAETVEPETDSERCQQQLQRADDYLYEFRRSPHDIYPIVKSLQHIIFAVTQLNERITALAKTVEMLSGDDFGDGLPF